MAMNLPYARKDGLAPTPASPMPATAGDARS